MRLLTLGLVFVACLVIVSCLENEESERAKRPKPSKGKKPKPKPPGGKTKPKPKPPGGGKGSGITGGKGSGKPGGGKGSGITGGKGSGAPGGKGSGAPGGQGSGGGKGPGTGGGMGTQWQKVWELIQNLKATLMALQQSGAGVPPPKGSGSGMPPPKGSGSGMPPPKGSGSGMPPSKGSTNAPSGSTSKPVTSKPVTGDGESEIFIRQTWCQEEAGFDRRAIVRQPTTSTPGEKVPLVICLHGNGGSANLAQWKELWENNLVVAAEGYDRSWNIWKEASKAPDVEFILDLIQKVGEEHSNADMDDVVIVGYSNGAGMIHRLLVETENPRPFHKVIPMASTLIQEQYNGGKFYKSSSDDCAEANVYDIEVTPASPGPMVFQVHGTEDGAIKYTGGTTFATFLGAQDTVFYYAKAFGYIGSQLADDAGEATIVDNVFKYSYLDGQVNHYKVVGGTHGDTGKYVWDIVKAIVNP